MPIAKIKLLLGKKADQAADPEQQRYCVGEICQQPQSQRSPRSFAQQVWANLA